MSAHLILLDLITRTILGEEYRSLSSSLCSAFHLPVTSSLLGPNILLSNLVSNVLSLRSPLSASDQVLHPYKTRGKITARKELRCEKLQYCIQQQQQQQQSYNNTVINTVYVIQYCVSPSSDEKAMLLHGKSPI